jgi:hypothetical protein
MSYTMPTVTTFKARYPEFGVVQNELVQLVLDEAIATVGDCWLEKDRAKAQMLLAAHTLVMEGEPQRSTQLANGGTVNSAAIGQILELQDRDVKVKFSDKSQDVAQNSGLGDIARSYMLTPYGKEYYLILGRNVASVVVV